MSSLLAKTLVTPLRAGEYRNVVIFSSFIYNSHVSSSVSVGSGGDTALADELASTDVGVGASEDEACTGTSVVAGAAELAEVSLLATGLLLGAAGVDTGMDTGAVELATGVEVGAGAALETEAGPLGVSPLRTQPDLAVMAAGQLTSSQFTLLDH